MSFKEAFMKKVAITEGDDSGKLKFDLNNLKSGDRVIIHYGEEEISISLVCEIGSIDVNDDSISLKVVDVYGIDAFGVEMTPQENKIYISGKSTITKAISSFKWTKTGKNIHAKLRKK